MTKPITFCELHGIKFMDFMRFGAFDPILNYDTRLFINPLLLPTSATEEFSDFASDLFQKHFSMMFRVMMRSEEKNDAHWKAATKLLQFPEIRFTCLGYGKDSTRGSSFGVEKTDRILLIASQVASVGIEDPFILPLYSLLEKDIGPDLISDMTTNVILDGICAYTKRACEHFGIKTSDHKIKGKMYKLPTNPYDDAKGPILLTALDILTELPTATNWSEAMRMASMNSSLRQQINDRLGEIFKNTALSESEKRKARLALIGSADAFKIFSDFMKARSKKPYDFKNDPAAVLLLQKLSEILPEQIPMDQASIATAKSGNLEKITAVIVEQFRHLVENMGFCKELWVNGKPAREAVAQRLFFAISYAYLQEHNVDINAEPDMGLGLIDFKLSAGLDKVVIEIKKSNNGKLVQGLRNQLATYCLAEKSQNGIYLVIDYDKPESRRVWLSKLKEEARAIKDELGIKIKIVVVDSREQQAPSKRN